MLPWTGTLSFLLFYLFIVYISFRFVFCLCLCRGDVKILDFFFLVDIITSFENMSILVMDTVFLLAVEFDNSGCYLALSGADIR